MANFTQNDAVLVSGVLTLEGTQNDDTFTITNSFFANGVPPGLIEGLGGFDRLILNAAGLSDVTISGIEATDFNNTGTNTIDAAQIANLGTIG
ncbi:MAG: hypothetical protein AAGI34_08205, partial [Pseudomonadota bacterium]